uniref:Receptor protein-tyrosine kinase n=1 Tax=Panagrolaimus sp. JU765 TaxID=591449 RepID=A0AC34RJ08_9BILA
MYHEQPIEINQGYVTKNNEEPAAPRFKHSARLNHYNYLGDTVKLKCLAVGRPVPKVHWYRDDVYLNYSYIHNLRRYVEDEQHMSLEIKNIELGDKWKMLKFNRNGVDFDTVTDEICRIFRRVNENIMHHRRPACVEGPCTSTNYGKINFTVDVSTTLTYKDVPSLANGVNPLLLTNLSSFVTDVLSADGSEEPKPDVPKINVGPKILEIDAKLQDMRIILKKRPSAASAENKSDDTLDDVRVDIDGEKVTLQPLKAEVFSTTIKPKENEITESDEPEEVIETTTFFLMETTTRSGWWPGPKRLTNLAPYFTQAVYHNSEPIIAPAGRTIKLSCRAHGIPEPLINWLKDNNELGPDSERFTTAKYRFTAYTLEMEDAVESDSGRYTCEVFNKHGTIKRNFDVRIVDRSRSKPIIVPNILLNQTVDVNSTVNFTCKVISDTLPHFTWAKLLSINESYINYTDPRKPQFNLVDVQFLPRIKVYRDARNTVMSIVNVTLEDQGIYSCITGNSLGVTMGNATLVVNEFRPKTLPTDPIPPPTDFQFILFFGLVFLAVAILAAVATYIICQRRQSKNRIQNLDKIAVFKKVVITRKPPKEGEIWQDLASSYAITIEPVVREHENDKSGNQEGNCGYEVPTDPKWEIERQRLNLHTKIGEGAFGEVWQGNMQSDERGNEIIPVAVKKLKDNAGDKELLILVGEMQIFKSIGTHKNVLKLIGCCTGIGDLFVVLELCPYGNLRSFLQSHRPVTVEPESQNDTSVYHTETENLLYQPGSNEQIVMKKLWLRDLIRFAAEIARGMEFLAAKKIIHRDLAARNVLVAEGFTMKISDFGLSRNVIHNNYYRKQGNGNLPIKWMAPECLDEGKHIYTTMSDVWSYGIIVWEIMTLGEQPYKNIPVSVLYEKLMAGYRMDSPPNCPSEIYAVMQRCWREVPEERPSFQVMAGYFEAILSNETRYKDELPSDSSYQSSENDEEEKLIYDTPKRKEHENLMTTTVDAFDEFVSKHDYQNLENLEGENEFDPLLGEKQTSLTEQTKKNPREPYYFNMEAEKQQKCLPAHFNWSERSETENDSDGPGSGTSRRSSDARSNSFKVVEHDYVNEELPHSNNPSTKSASNNNVSAGIRNSGLSENLALDLEMGAMIYSSPPSKKSSVSNLSVNVATTLATSARNGFIQRSYSTESQTSSGRGGSSAMSSAEGIVGLSDLCQIEYTTIDNNKQPRLLSTPFAGSSGSINTKQSLGKKT